MPVELVPDDDLYARLGVAPDAEAATIEAAWRGLFKVHHPDVAGDDAAALDRAKRINVARDWLTDPVLRARYDRDRLGGGRGPRAAAARARSGRGPRRRAADVERGDPAVRLARFLERLATLDRDEADRLSVARPPGGELLDALRDRLPAPVGAELAAAEAAAAHRLGASRLAAGTTAAAVRGVLAEIVLGPHLDEALAEPVRGRVRDRLLGAWEASVGQSRHGPNGAAVAALRARVGRATPDELLLLVAAGRGIPAADRPWPAVLDPDEDEALRVSAVLAAADLAAAVPAHAGAGSATERARDLAARLGHLLALRHAVAPAAWPALVAPGLEAFGPEPVLAPPARHAAAPAPEVRRAG